MLFWSQTINVAIALFIITDVLGSLPFFISLTQRATSAERAKISVTAILTGLFLLGFFVFAGRLIFDLFSLTFEDLIISGGILLLIIAIELLFRSKVEVEYPEDVGVVPLGCPLLVGPGAITTVLIMSKIYPLAVVAAGVLFCFALIWLILHFADKIYQIIGRNGALIITKISAIIIAAIAVRFVRQGILAVFNLPL